MRTDLNFALIGPHPCAGIRAIAGMIADAYPLPEGRTGTQNIAGILADEEVCAVAHPVTIGIGRCSTPTGMAADLGTWGRLN